MANLKQIENYLERIGLQWTYVLISPDYPWRCKVGWSGSFNARINDIRYTMSRETGKQVRVWVAIKLPMFWAKRTEAAIHSWPLWLCAKMPGSGRTEWSWVINVYSSLLCYFTLLAIGYECPAWPAAILLVAPLPIDFAFFNILTGLIQYAAVGAVAYCVWATIF